MSADRADRLLFLTMAAALVLGMGAIAFPALLVPARLGVAAAAAATLFQIATRVPLLAVWAPVCLALLVTVAYSVLPWGAYPLAMARFHSLAMESYVGSAAERLVLSFGALMVLVAAGALARWRDWPGFTPFLGKAARALAAGLTLGGAVGWAAAGIWFDASWAALFPPVFCAAAAALIVDGTARSPRAGLMAAIVVAASGAVPFAFLTLMKPTAFVLGGAALLFVCRWRGRVWLGALGILAVAVALLAGVGIVRGIEQGLGPLTTVLGKVYFRQGEVGHCLEGVVEAGPGQGSPLYFVNGLVPRWVWPDKPSLSNGAEYGRRYCPAGEIGGHSASVSLIGEPLAEAGWPGLAAAAVTFALMQGGVLLAIRRMGAPAAAAALGMLPWLADFDQHFAMYLANAVKMSILALVLVWLPLCFLRERTTENPRG